jgi:cobaltochelatase CobT
MEIYHMRQASFDAKTSGTTSAVVVTVPNNGGRQEQGVLARDLMTELMGVVPILGGQKVTVGFAGEGAFCDSTFKYVNIPALPEAEVIPLQIAREIRGFAHHEAAHIAFTDPSVFPSALFNADGTFKKDCDALLKETWNCIEDFMIERDWLELYPGSRKNFAATEIRCCRGYMDLYQKDPDCAKDLRRVGPVALTWLRALDFNLGTQISRECFDTMPPALRQRVLDWFADIQDVETTQDCLEAARRIRADIQANPFDPQNPPKNTNPPQNNGQSGKGQSGQGQSGKGQSRKGQSGQGQSGQAGKGQAGQNSSPGAGDQGGAAGAPDATSQGPNPIPTSHDLDSVLNAAKLKDPNANYVSAQVVTSTKKGPYKDILSDPSGHRAAEDAAKDVRGAMAATAAQMRRALKAIARDRWKGGRLEGRLDAARLAGVAVGNFECHKRKVRGEDIDTAVSVLIDCSGSMGNGQLDICQQLALILEQAFANTKIKHEIVGFTTADMADADPSFKTMIAAHAKKAGSKVQGRAVGLYEFRKFGQSHHSALCTIGNMTKAPMGYTPTSDAILFTHDRLAQRQEQRHVMFVLTDGSPDNNAACKKAVQAVERCGVTVVGIGICTSKVERAFSKHVVVNSANDLPAIMMRQLSQILIGDRGKVALNGRSAAKRRAS